MGMLFGEKYPVLAAGPQLPWLKQPTTGKTQNYPRIASGLNLEWAIRPLKRKTLRQKHLRLPNGDTLL